MQIILTYKHFIHVKLILKIHGYSVCAHRCVLAVSAHMCVHMWYVQMCIHLYVQMLAGLNVCRGQRLTSGTSCSPPYALRQPILLSLEPTNSVRLGGQQAPESLQPQVWVLGYGNMLSCRCYKSQLIPSCFTSVLLSELSSQTLWVDNNSAY